MTLPAYLHPFCKPARESFVTIARGEGSVVWDTDGNEYIDAMASLWCVNAGHGRREIIDAVTAQMEQLAVYQTFEPFANEPSDRVADDIVARAEADIAFRNALVPVMLGGGLPLFPAPGPRVALRLDKQRLYEKSGIMLLEYEVVRGNDHTETPRKRRRGEQRAN